jgi:hypothetical protein
VSFPDQKSAIEAQPLIAVRNVRASSRWYVELLGADAIPEHPHRDVYDRTRTLVGCFFNCMRGTRRTTPISSTQTPRPLGTECCCVFRSTILTGPWSGLAGWGPRSSKNLTSIPPPNTGRFGSAIPMAM